MVKKKINKNKNNHSKKHETNSKSNISNTKNHEVKKEDSKNKTEKKKVKKYNNIHTILVLCFVLLIVIIGIIMIVSDKEETMNNIDEDNIELNKNYDDEDNFVENSQVIEVVGNTELSRSNIGNKVVLTIVEDPDCEFCQAMSYGEKIKLNLIPDLKIQTISHKSIEGKKIIDELNFKQVPAYLFNKNIENVESWDTQLSGVFDKVSMNGETYYSLKSNFIPNKILNEKLVIDKSTIVIGSQNAPVTVYEFGDYACHGCGLAYGNEEILEQYLTRNPNYEAPILKVFEEYVDTGKVKYVFINMPSEVLNPGVTTAHLAALCANEQNQWLKYHNNLFENRDEWVLSDDKNSKMKKFAEELGLDKNKFNNCLDSKKYQSQIDEELKLSEEYEVSGTPTFYIERNFLSGPQDYRMFQLLIDDELSNK